MPGAAAMPDTAIAAIEKMETQPLTPGSAAAQAVAVAPARAKSASSLPPAPPRSRRGLLLVVAAIGFVLAGFAFALVWKDPSAPPPRVPTAARKPAPAPVVAPVPPPVQPPAPAPAPALPAEAIAAPAEPAPARVRPLRARPAQTAPKSEPKLAPAPATPAPSAPAPRPPAPAASTAPAGETADALNKLAGQALLQGHLARAADLYTQATARDPRSAPAWRGLGITSERLGRTRDAVRAYRRALQLAPTGQQAESVRERLGQLE
jgi:hypothetical protein